MVDKLDVLAIGAHPDDVELGVGGTLWQQAQLGKRVGVLDLTQGEMGTRGTVESRKEEAAAAAGVLGAVVRENAGFADGFFKHDDEHIVALVRYIRRWQPDILIINAPDDRHPRPWPSPSPLQRRLVYGRPPKAKHRLGGRSASPLAAAALVRLYPRPLARPEPGGGTF